MRSVTGAGDQREERLKRSALFTGLLPMLAKAPNRKRALEYFAASGAVPISVTERRTIRRQCRLV